MAFKFNVTADELIRAATAVSQLGNTTGRQLQEAYKAIQDMSNVWIGNQYDKVSEATNKRTANFNNTINSFINNLNFPRNTYFLEGMNGSNSCTQNNTIQQEHNSHFNNINFNHTTGNDHSKVLFFLDTTAYEQGSIIVKAVLIGSSNQSYSTYFATPKRGEADLFIIESDAVETPNATIDKDEYIRSQFLDEWIENDDNVVVSQEISRHNHHLLYDIFSDFFNI